MSKQKNSFIEDVKSLLEGENADAVASKIQRQAVSALSAQVACYTGDVVALEDAVEEAKEQLKKAKVNYAKPITDRVAYVENFVDAKNKLLEAETALEEHKATLEFLKEELESIEVTSK